MKNKSIKISEEKILDFGVKLFSNILVQQILHDRRKISSNRISTCNNNQKI